MKAIYRFALLMMFSSISFAGTITLNAQNSGWYADNGTHQAYTQPNITAGVCTACLYKGESRNFFLFDLSGVSESIVSAELRITSGNYGSSDPFEIFTLFRFSGDPSILPTNITPNAALFEDLGSGQEYGDFQIQHNSDSVISINLNSFAVGDMNSANGLFAIGGTITSLDNDFSRTQVAFSGTHNGDQTRELILTTVPVPGAIWLFVSGLSVLSLRHRKNLGGWLNVSS